MGNSLWCSRIMWLRKWRLEEEKETKKPWPQLVVWTENGKESRPWDGEADETNKRPHLWNKQGGHSFFSSLTLAQMRWRFFLKTGTKTESSTSACSGRKARTRTGSFLSDLGATYEFRVKGVIHGEKERVRRGNESTDPGWTELRKTGGETWGLQKNAERVHRNSWREQEGCTGKAPRDMWGTEGASLRVFLRR